MIANNIVENHCCVMSKTEKCYGFMGLEFNESEIDLAQSVGKPTIDKNSKKQYK